MCACFINLILLVAAVTCRICEEFNIEIDHPILEAFLGDEDADSSEGNCENDVTTEDCATACELSLVSVQVDFAQMGRPIYRLRPLKKVYSLTQCVCLLSVAPKMLTVESNS